MKKTIFIVDDNDSNLTSVALAFEDDFNVFTIPSVAKMFSLLNKKTPDIILMDIEMPVMNGFEAITELKKNEAWSDIPVVVMSGWVTAPIKERATELGVKEVFAKPFSLKQAKEIIKGIVNNNIIDQKIVGSVVAPMLNKVESV